jgi:hypothetical protein
MGGMQREISLDAWRGLMLVDMAVYHLGGPISAAVRQLFGYVSAAEGFVFLSGLMCGLVYTRYSRVSLREMFRRLWRRAWTIYRYHVGVLLILMVFISVLSVLEPRLAAYYVGSDLAGYLAHPAETLVTSLLCLHLPQMIGILGLYVAYIAAAPFILTLFTKGRALLAFTISTALWFFAQLGGSAQLASLLPGQSYLELGSFDAFGWQILFVAGCYFGWRRCNGLDVLPGMSTGLLLGALAVAAPLFVLRHWGPPLAPGDFWGATNLLRLGWLRVIDAAAVVLIVYGAARLYAVELRSPWLALLGRHSLQVFCFHSLVLYLGWSVLWRRHFLGDFSGFADAAAVALFAASLTLPALFFERRRSTRIAPDPMIAPKLDMAGARRYM